MDQLFARGHIKVPHFQLMNSPVHFINLSENQDINRIQNQKK